VEKNRDCLMVGQVDEFSLRHSLVESLNLRQTLFGGLNREGVAHFADAVASPSTAASTSFSAGVSASCSSDAAAYLLAFLVPQAERQTIQAAVLTNSIILFISISFRVTFRVDPRKAVPVSQSAQGHLCHRCSLTSQV
jgi:hypothetical protein